MRLLHTALLVLISNYSFGQIKAIVIDNVSGAPIPDVNIWIENEDIGTTSNQLGAFTIEGTQGAKTVVFSAIGYHTKRVPSNLIGSHVKLHPKILELKEVTVSPKKGTDELLIGSFDKSDVALFSSSGPKSLTTMLSRYFAYQPIYEKTPYLKKVSLLTNSRIKDARFRIWLYTINEEGAPGDLVYQNAIIGVARKRRRITTINISDLDIIFPEGGLYLVYEYLYTESNKHTMPYVKKGSKRKRTHISYEPSVGMMADDTAENGRILSKGQWKRMPMNPGFPEGYKNKYALLAVEVTLSN